MKTLTYRRCREICRRTAAAAVVLSMLATLWPVDTVRAQTQTAVPTSPLLQPSTTLTPRLTTTASPIKDVTRLRSEAALYDTAVAEIGKLATMRLDTPDALRAAMATIERHRANLKFYGSKIAVMGLADPLVVAAIKRKIVDERSAIAYLKAIDANPAIAMQLEGAPALVARVQAAFKADSDRVSAAARTAKAAAKTIGGVDVSVASAAAKVMVGVLQVYGPFVAVVCVVALLPVTLPAAAVAAVIAVALTLGVLMAAVFVIVGTDGKADETKDSIGTCLAGADTKLSSCKADARDAAVREFAEAACYAAYLIDTAACLLE